MLSYRILLVSALLVLAGIGLVNVRVEDADSMLIRRQLEKVTQPADILFVGDSSLGNSLDSGLASSLVGRRVLNLALTGGYGLPGSQWMIERHLAAGHRPQAIYVIQTANVFPRPVSKEEVLSRLDGLDLRRTFSGRLAMAKLPLLWRGAGARTIDGDYVTQGSPLDPATIPASLPLGPVSSANARALTEIGALCRTRGIDCFLGCGPVIAMQQQDARRYFATSLPDVPGLQRLDRVTPMAIPATDIGDSTDHVLPSRKAAYTAMWATIVKDTASEHP